jgi:hypothetical protein
MYILSFSRCSNFKKFYTGQLQLKDKIVIVHNWQRRERHKGRKGIEKREEEAGE